MLSLLGLVLSTPVFATDAREITHATWTIRWSPTQLSIVEGDDETIIYVNGEDERDEDGMIVGSQSHAVISVVGPWVTTSYSYYSLGGSMHYGKTWQTMDVSRGGRSVSLLDLFSEEVLLEALRANPVIAAAQTDPTPRPLLDTLATLNGGCDVYASPEMLKAWVFEEVSETTVSITMGLPHADNVCRGTFTKVRLELPLPTYLRGALAEAEARGTLYGQLTATPESP